MVRLGCQFLVLAYDSRSINETPNTKGHGCKVSLNKHPRKKISTAQFVTFEDLEPWRSTAGANA